MFKRILTLSGWIIAIILFIVLSVNITNSKFHPIGNYHSDAENVDIYMTLFPSGEAQIYYADGQNIKKGTINQFSDKMAAIDDIVIVSVDGDIATWIDDKFFIFKKESNEAFLFSNK